MAGKEDGALPLQDSLSGELGALVRLHTEALKAAPVIAEPAAVEKAAKAIAALGRADLIVRQVKAAEDKARDAAREATLRRAQHLEEMDMNDIPAAELERRAEELRARCDRILALLDTKQCGRPGPLGRVGTAVEVDRDLDSDGERRAA